MTDVSIRLELVDGEPMADSRDIAEHFGKEHRHVLRAIDEHLAEMAALEGAAQNWATLQFKELRAWNPAANRETRHYLLNRAAFSLVVMSFTGSAALKWKLAYIDAFERMQAEIERLRSGIAMPSIEEISKAILPKVGEMIAHAMNEMWCRVVDREKALIERVGVAAVEKAVMHERGDFIRYVSARSVCLMAGVDPKGRRGMTHRVSTALRCAGVPYRYDPEAESGCRYKFEPTAAHAWMISPAGRAFFKALDSSYKRARGDNSKVVEFQPPLPGTH